MLKKRIIITLTFLDGVLFRTKYFKPDYRYTKNFIDLWSIDELILLDISKEKFSKQFLDILGTGKTLIQQTFSRVSLICPQENIFIATNKYWYMKWRISVFQT